MVFLHCTSKWRQSLSTQAGAGSRPGRTGTVPWPGAADRLSAHSPTEQQHQQLSLSGD